MEFYKLCNSCGKGFVYTDSDVRENERNAKNNIWSGIGQISGALSGNFAGAMANKMNEKELRDFGKCPHCGSHDLRTVTKEEFQQSNRKVVGATASVINTTASVESLIKRTRLLLEDGEWNTAKDYCNSILDKDPENGEVYLLMLLADTKNATIEDLKGNNVDIENNKNYKRIRQFGSTDLVEELDSFVRNRKLNEQYERARLYQEFYVLDSQQKAEEIFESLGKYKDSEQQKEQCRIKIEQIKENARLEAEREEEKHRKTTKKALLICIPIICVVIALVVVLVTVILPNSKKQSNESNMEDNGNIYTENDDNSYLEGGVFDAGEFTVNVPSGWKAFSEDGYQVIVGKGANNNDDAFIKPNVRIFWFDPSVTVEEARGEYDNVEDITGVIIKGVECDAFAGSLTGYTGNTPVEYRYEIIQCKTNECNFVCQVLISIGKEEMGISWKDTDVKNILESLSSK